MWCAGPSYSQDFATVISVLGVRIAFEELLFEKGSWFGMSEEKRYHANLLNSVDRWAYARQENISSQDSQTIERYFKHSVRGFKAFLGKYLPSQKDVLILDLPCGEGRVVYVLQAMGYKNVSGYDLDVKRLETGRKLELPIYEGDAFEILKKQEDNSVGCIFSMDFLEHLEKEKVIEFLELTYRKITAGGKIFLRTPCADSPFGSQHIYNDFTHKWAATSGVLYRLLSSVGFSEVFVFGEEPKIGMRFGFLRVLSYKIAKSVAGVFLILMNLGKQKIWSRSMWAVAKK